MTHALRRIDHVVVAVHDLDSAATFYERLGFRVGARNRHPWGTENRLIQFGRSFIELITIAPDAAAILEHEEGRFSFGAFVRDYLHEREGLAMLVLDSKDAQADAALFTHEGISSFEPLYFEREGRQPDGSKTKVAFTLAFAIDPHAPQAGFFVCQQHFPENFWNPAFQRHDNGATGIASVGMIAAQPRDHEAFLAAFSGSAAEYDTRGRLSIALAGGRLTVERDSTRTSKPFLSALAIEAPSLAKQLELLHSAAIPFTENEDSLSISSEIAHGLTIVFQPVSAT